MEQADEDNSFMEVESDLSEFEDDEDMDHDGDNQFYVQLEVENAAWDERPYKKWVDFTKIPKEKTLVIGGPKVEEHPLYAQLLCPTFAPFRHWTRLGGSPSEWAPVGRCRRILHLAGTLHDKHQEPRLVWYVRRRLL